MENIVELHVSMVQFCVRVVKL